MKVLLCSPNGNKPIYNQSGELPHLTGICPPLGIGYLGSTLRQDGHDVALYDFEQSSEGEIREAIKKEGPDVVGVSCFTLARGAAFDVVRLVKKINCGIHTVLGGSHATAFPEQILNHYPEVDAVVLGEGEVTLKKWIDCLSDDRNPVNIPDGVACRSGGKVVINGRAPFMENLDSLPFPTRKLNNNPAYKPFPEHYKQGTQMSMIASRGCPYRCQFCSTSVFWGARYRMRSVDNVIREIEQLINEGIEDIEILDDALTVKKTWIVALCNEIKKRKLKFDWTATTRANYIDEEICNAMKRAGCRRVILGIESFSDKILKQIHKGINSDQAVGAIRLAQKAGLKACCLLMVGNPGETWDTINDSIKAIKASRPDSLTINPVQVYPQTELYELAKQGGLVGDSYWLDESRAAPIFTLENSVEQLKEFEDALYDAHWSNHWYVQFYRRSGLRKLRQRFQLAGKTREE